MIYGAIYILVCFIVVTIINPLLIIKTKVWHKTYFFFNKTYLNRVEINDSLYNEYNFYNHPQSEILLKDWYRDNIYLLYCFFPIYTLCFIIFYFLKLIIYLGDNIPRLMVYIFDGIFVTPVNMMFRYLESKKDKAVSVKDK
jgi:hypothetical protein